SRERERRDDRASIRECAPRAEKWGGIVARREIRTERHENAARKAVAEPDHRSKHGKPYASSVDVVGKRERKKPKSHEKHRRSHSPDPAESIHDLAAHVEERKIE